MQPDITTQHLQGTSELTLLATIKPGLVPLLDTRSHASRLRAVLATLNTLRKTSREHSLVRPFSDSTDRIRTITDLRMAIVAEEQPVAGAPALLHDRKLLLSVTFDRPWEPYLRTIWSDVGSLLDLIFCNCSGYPISIETSLADYAEWVRAARTNTRYFYRPSGLSFDDESYLRQTERLLRAVPTPTGTDSALAAAVLAAADPEQQARAVADAHFPERVRLGMQALSVLYRLTDLYRTDGDRQILLRAAHELLRELTPILPLPAALAAVTARFAPQLAWFMQRPAAPSVAPPPIPPLAPDSPIAGSVQRGIVSSHGERISHGCVLLIGVVEPKRAADLLTALGGMLSTEPEPGAPEPPAGHIHVNVGFTAEGLRRLGLGSTQMARFPAAFLDGMEQRAGLLGDVRGNHPLHWSLPERNWPLPVDDPVTGRPPRVQLSTVHIVVQMCMRSDDTGHELIEPLRDRIDALMAPYAARNGGPPALQLLSVQPTRRQLEPAHGGRPREHFGFIDGFSQPEVGRRPALRSSAVPAAPRRPWSNLVGRGELLLGYVNDNGDPPTRDLLTDNGSFLVIRKLRQDVAAWNAALAGAGLDAEFVKARMTGRTPDGMPLAGTGPTDAFDYEGDKDARRCPFEAHIRRANPRTADTTAGRPTVPRIMRRGMSYGPRYGPGTEDAERGVMFMAYNASIAEQFEVVQRWLGGGNGSGVLSEHSDPLVGVPQIGESRTFRCRDGAGKVVNVLLDDAGAEPSRPFVRLEWGVYLFVPSKPALAELARVARAAVPPVGVAPEVVARGLALIAGLEQQARAGLARQALKDAWKELLEDQQARADGASEAVWAAIRERRGGVLETPYGVLVASHALVERVLENRHGRYSVCGYLPRLDASIGRMYLGLDDGPAYRAQSARTNALIMAVDERQAFDAARRHAKARLDALVGLGKALVDKEHDAAWEVTLDIKEISDHTLAALCDDWFFGARDQNTHLAPGGWRWDWHDGQPPLYPGHFTAPSRYVFQPRPGPTARADGEQLGSTLRRVMTDFVDARRLPGAAPVGTLATAMFDDPALAGGDLLARTLLGVLIGFLPTVEGSFRSTLNEWLDGGMRRTTLQDRLPAWSLWELQNLYIGDRSADSYAKACAHLRTPLLRTLQLRPVPELSWRRAVDAHTLGGVAVRPGQMVVVGSVSATQQMLSADQTDVCPVFGGRRQAGNGARNGPEPTATALHACPGRDIGTGVLLGMLAALLEAGPLRPTPAPLTVGLRGPV